MPQLLICSTWKTFNTVKKHTQSTSIQGLGRGSFYGGHSTRMSRAHFEVGVGGVGGGGGGGGGAEVHGPFYPDSGNDTMVSNC